MERYGLTPVKYRILTPLALAFAAMNEMLGQVVFAVGSSTYCWEDVVLAGKLWGDWADLENELRQGLACIKRINVTGGSLTAGAVETLAKEFRYRRNLITASETESWLKKWGLSLDDWMAYFRRSSLRQRWASELTEILAEYPVSDDEVNAHIKTEAICSERLAQLAHKLSGRAAVYERVLEDTPPEEANPDLPSPGNYSLAGLSPELSRQKMAAFALMEAAYQRFCRQLVTPESIKDMIASHYMDWIRFELRAVQFPDEQSAREAAMCVREDGMDLAEVAADARRPLREERVYLDGVEPALKALLLGAQERELIGPVCLAGEQVVLLVKEKLMPACDDPEISLRAEKELVKSAVGHQVNNRVRWLATL